MHFGIRMDAKLIGVGMHTSNKFKQMNSSFTDVVRGGATVWKKWLQSGQREMATSGVRDVTHS